MATYLGGLTNAPIAKLVGKSGLVDTFNQLYRGNYPRRRTGSTLGNVTLEETMSEIDPFTGEPIFDKEAFFTRALESVKNGQPVPQDPNVIWGDPNAVTVEQLETTLSLIRQSQTPEMQALHKANMEEYRKALESGTYQVIELPPDFVPPMLTPFPYPDGTPWGVEFEDGNTPTDRLLAELGVPEGPVTIPFSEVPADSPFRRFIENFL